MTTIIAILISVKDHLFPPLRQIESKLGWRVKGNMEIQNCLNIQFGSHGNNLDFFQKAWLSKPYMYVRLYWNMLEGMGLTWE